MNDLIESLQILAKYVDPTDHCPTHCEHDILLAVGTPEAVSEPDRARLDALGWHWSEEYECWASFRFGSA